MSQASGRRQARTDKDKLATILSAISDSGWSLSMFLYKLFQIYDNRTGKEDQRITRDTRHQQMVLAMLQGTSKPFFGELLELIYLNAQSVGYRQHDTSMPDRGRTFDPSIPLKTIRHAQPAITVWAVEFVADCVRAEAKRMVHVDTGLHLRAWSKLDSKRKRNATSARATWEAVDSFSMSNLQETAEMNAPVTWHIVASYVDPEHNSSPRTGVIAVRRPKNMVSTGAIMSMTFGRSERANFYGLCKGLWLFSAKAHHSIYRVESRMGQSVSYSSVYSALGDMAQQSLDDLKSTISSGGWVLVVGDNIQTYARARDHRLGRESRMIKGYAGTVVEMQDYEPGAADLDVLVTKQALQERRQLTTQQILDDINNTHLDNVAAGDFLETLIAFVPALGNLRNELDQWIVTTLTKKQIPPTRKSKITPLATNSSDEIHVQGMKQGVLDFFSVQMGINKETLANRCFVKSGDGKTFDQLHKLKKYLVAEDGDFESFRWLVPLLELWHTKWTDLSRVARAHWGKDFPDDPSTLAFAAKQASCPTPNDLRKVDFYDGAHIVNLTLDANLLNVWEGHFKTSNLVSYFEDRKGLNTLPTFQDLLDTARTLVQIYATTRAFQRAVNPLPDDSIVVPLGSAWEPPLSSQAISRNEDAEMESVSGHESDGLSEFSTSEEPSSDADITLGNSILFMRNAIWWREVCRAIARGDTGRVWEIMKIWIFTFAGSGNPFYSQYLLELYCNFKYEFSPKLRDAILMNWLVNLHGRPGMFIEMDLMQEHFNFWLEEMAQHKGKEFDEPFYRKVISANVHHFLQLKDEMEMAVSLKARTKNHGEPHLNNELTAIMNGYRKAQVNRRRPGRDEGFHAVDDFSVGVELLERERLASFITRTTAYSDIAGLRIDPMETDTMEDGLEQENLPLPMHNAPPPRIFLHGNELLMEERE